MASKSTRPLTKLASQHQRLWNEQFEGELERDFQALELDGKPAILVEVIFDPEQFSDYTEFVKELDKFQDRAWALGFWSFMESYPTPGFFDMYLSKIRSVALALRTVDSPPSDYQAGAIGLLLGYPFKDVLAYVRRQAPHELLRNWRPQSGHSKPAGRWKERPQPRKRRKRARPDSEPRERSR